MQVHDLQPENNKKDNKKRIGRGGKWRTYGGQGDKGQKSRAGDSTISYEERIIKKFPKLRGVDNPPKSPDAQVVNLGKLDSYFEDGDIISKESLIEKGLIDKGKKKVKLLGDGDTEKSFKVKIPVSSGAQEKIKEAGGEVLENE
ncbi:MAG: 50S ribosomal protein L15 [Candidatus Magasanikbacteria bacterium]